ncbi:hypothetical protein ANO11243_088980 [Dothideomycetidae sp. 11243]|nr:hypothetical protein ANO11243_088980 [fungal sp. No.11243]
MALADVGTARQSAFNRLKTLINQDLKEICRQENLQVSGVKASLQSRIMAHLDEAINSRDMVTFERVRYRILNRGAGPPTGYTGSNMGSGMSMSPGVANSHISHQYSKPQLVPSAGQRPQLTGPAKLSFKPSPFYHIQDSITRATDLPDMPANRNTITVQVVLSENVCDLLRTDPNLRVMLYCTTASPLSHYSEFSDVAFPSQIEVKMNQEDVKSNYKGLKNKPGTTKPADLTSYLRKQPRYPNNLQVTYALTTRKYSFVVNLVRKATAEELMEKIKRGRIITKETVLHEMSRKARDPDIEATSTVMSLKDPVSTMRMDLPCRSAICTHNQCFDALCFIQLQEQAPTWTCPVCNKTISYEALAVDHYVLDILNRTSKSVEQVTIEPEGNWKEISQNDDDQQGKSQPRASYDDDDSGDDLVEISDVRSGVSLHKDITHSATSAMVQHMTPPLSSREASVSQNGRNKRPSAVIDLTLSDEDEPPRPAKRPNLTNVTTSYNTPSSNSDRSQENQPRPMATLYTGFALAQSPQSAHGASPRPPETNGQSGQGQRTTPSPWPANYQSYNGWNPGINFHG